MNRNRIGWLVLFALCSCAYGQIAGPGIIPMGPHIAVKPTARPNEWRMYRDENLPEELSKSQVTAAIKFIKDHPARVIRLDNNLKSYDVPTEVNSFFACNDINEVKTDYDSFVYSRTYPVDFGNTGFLAMDGYIIDCSGKNTTLALDPTWTDAQRASAREKMFRSFNTNGK